MEEKGEVSPKAVEIVHTKNFDLIVNLNYKNQLAVKELKEILKNGIPTSWIPWADPYSNDDEDEVNPTLYFIDAEPPRFFAKTRKNFTARKVREVLEGKYFGMGGKRGIQAFSSLINEIELSSQIKEASEDTDLKDILEKYGFNKLIYVEPIMGLIERKTGKK